MQSHPQDSVVFGMSPPVTTFQNQMKIPSAKAKTKPYNKLNCALDDLEPEQIQRVLVTTNFKKLLATYEL